MEKAEPHWKYSEGTTGFAIHAQMLSFPISSYSQLFTPERMYLLS